MRFSRLYREAAGTDQTPVIPAVTAGNPVVWCVCVGVCVCVWGGGGGGVHINMCHNNASSSVHQTELMFRFRIYM